MKIALLASSSFLGQALDQALSQNPQFEILRFSRQTPPYFDYPKRPWPMAELLNCQAIFYCAGAGIQPGHGQSNLLQFQINAQAPIELCYHLQADGYTGKLFTFGSYFELGEQAPNSPSRDENYLWQHGQKLPNAYCQSKNLLSRFVGQSLQHPLPFTLRHFVLNNVYGAGENPKRLLPYLFEQGQKQAKLEFTAGLQTRQYTHVKDLARFLVQSIDEKASGIFNLGDAETYSVRQVIEMALQILNNQGFTPEVQFGTATRSDLSMAHLALDTSKIELLGGFQPQISLEQGLLDYLQPCL